MSRRGYVAEHWRRVFRHPRVLFLGVAASLAFYTIFHFTYSARDKYYLTDPSYSPHNPQVHGDYFPDLVDVQDILENDPTAVRCDWADVDAQAILNISDKGGPSFSLLSAWLKPEAARFGPALKSIPLVLRAQFSLGGRVRFEKFFFDQAYLGGKAMQSVWNIADVDHYRSEVRARREHFTYDNRPIYEALDRWATLVVKGKRGLVIGSETPWLEAMLLEYGAANVSTLEFGEIQTDHPQITAYTPAEFTLMFLQGKIPPFDFAFSYSSLEHDGLGRYGDVLNPIGDLQSMARMLSAVRPGGFMFLGVPCCEDAVYWNAHRVYGPIRYSEMFAGWRVLGSSPRDAMRGTRGSKGDWVFQPVWALQNRMGCRGGFRARDIADMKDIFL